MSRLAGGQLDVFRRCGVEVYWIRNEKETFKEVENNFGLANLRLSCSSEAVARAALTPAAC